MATKNKVVKKSDKLSKTEKPAGSSPKSIKKEVSDKKINESIQQRPLTTVKKPRPTTSI